MSMQACIASTSLQKVLALHDNDRSLHLYKGRQAVGWLGRHARGIFQALLQHVLSQLADHLLHYGMLLPAGGQL